MSTPGFAAEHNVCSVTSRVLLLLYSITRNACCADSCEREVGCAKTYFFFFSIVTEGMKDDD